LTIIKNHFKTAWRALIKNKGISILNISGLAVGMTAAVLIFLWVQNEMSFDTNHKDSDRIFTLTTMTTDHSWIWEGSPMLFAASLKNEIPEIEQVTRLYANNIPIFNINGNPQYEKQTAYVDPNWFSLFQYHFTEGSAAALDEHPFSIILTSSEAKKFFGNREAVGQLIRVDSMNYEVRGVVEDAPSNSSFQYKAFIPIAALLTNKEFRENGENWDNTDYLTFIKLPVKTNISLLSTRITKLLQKDTHDDKNGIAAALVALPDMHFENDLQASEFEHGNRNVVFIFSVLGFILLLVACINYVNLTTAKASLRSKEVSIRKIVGAGRKQLFFQFTVESAMVSFLSLAVSLILIYLCIPAFNSITGKTFILDLSSFSLWKVLGSALLLAFLLNSIYPALLLSSFKPLNMFRGITILKLKDSYFRKGLVILQFSVSIILLTGTIVIYQQMEFIRKTNPGYDRDQIITVGLPFNLHMNNKELFMKTMQQELSLQSPIETVSMVNQPVVRIGSATTGIDWDGHDSSFRPKVAQLSADASLLKTMHFTMAAGTWFNPGSQSDKNNYILNETAVRELNIHQPVIGQRFTHHGKSGIISGVVKDFHFKSLHEKVGSLIIFNDPEWWNYFMIRTKGKNAAGTVAAIEASWKKLAPGTPLEYSFLDERFNELYRQDKLASELIFIFAGIAVLISALGLFGLAAFATEQRTKEVGIRKILGASLPNIGLLLSRDFVKLVVIAIVIASPLAWWAMNSWLNNFAYRIDMKLWMSGMAGVFALLIALLITNYHALKAGLQNPAIRLRTE
jgi:ABC-type antimicrobial peptide transport system permease subunit